MDLTITPSPSQEISLTRYSADSFPKFRGVFDSGVKPALPFASASPEEAELAIVMENRSTKDLTALRYLWVMVSPDGQEKPRTVSSDSYFVDVYHPVLKAGDRKLICPSVTVDESLLDHVAAGGGCIGAGLASRTSCTEFATVRFEIDLLLFSDGEISGPDTDQYAVSLRFRRPAAEFVAKQIRLAETEGHDVAPVLKALAAMPHRPSDYPAKWIQYYASDFLRHMDKKIGNVDMREARLKHLENRPLLPKFYRQS